MKADAPMLFTRVATAVGELSFFTAFTTFGSPLDVTIASLRIEHLFAGGLIPGVVSLIAIGARGDARQLDQTLDRLVATYPNTLYRDEANFRRGELLFSLKDYPRAERAYSTVLGTQHRTEFNDRALYMQGWSRYRLQRWDDALDSLFGVLDLKLAAGPDAPELVKLRQYFDHPLFVEMFAEGIRDAAAALPPQLRDEARVVFTAHSIPVGADERHGPRLYSRQVGYDTRLVAAAAGYHEYDQVWQSRSGPPQIPWLEPDIGDHLAALAEAGTKAVIVCPIGFVADHIEVVWDLDNELAEQAAEAGITLVRTTTPNADPRFARLAASLVEELRTGAAPARVDGPDPAPGYGCSVDGASCSPHCCGD